MTRPSTRRLCASLWLALLLQAAPVEGESTDSALLLHLDLSAQPLLAQQCDFLFTMWSAETGGEPVAEPVRRSTWVAESGKALVELDIGPDDTEGWLETGVRCPAGVGDFETIAQRTRVSGPTLRVHP